MPSRPEIWVKRGSKVSERERANKAASLKANGSVYHLTLYDLAERCINIEPNVPFGFYHERRNEDTGALITEDMRYFKQIWSIDQEFSEASRTITMLCARQVGKSTIASAMGLCYQMIYPGYRMLYVQPTLQQVQVISNSRYAKIVDCSPLIKQDYWSTKNIWQLKHRQLTNKSEAYFRSCYLSVESSRGITAEGLHVDEFQDMIPENIGVLEHCQDRIDDWKFFRLFTATPYSRMNYASQCYYDSSQFEWMVECQHCGHWNMLDEDLIGAHFYECHQCHKEVYPKDCDHGKWIALNPTRIPYSVGYRIPQIISPTKDHGDLLRAKTNTLKPHYQFLNESLGLPSEEGNVQLTEAELKMACLTHKPNMTLPEIHKIFSPSLRLYMGIDWGAGEIKSSKRRSNLKTGVQTTAFTVITIGAWIRGILVIFYMEKLIGEKAHLETQIEYVDKLARAYRVDIVGSDWGFGADKNALLIHKYKWRNKVNGYGDGPVLMECQNLGNDAAKEVVYDQKASHFSGRYKINRNWLVYETLSAIKEKSRIKFPPWNFLSNRPFPQIAFARDFLNIYKEYDTSRNKFVFGSMGIDDAFFAVALMYLAARLDVHEVVPVPLYQLALNEQEPYHWLDEQEML